MNVKVIDSKNFSKEDVKNFLLLYEKLLRQYRPRGFSKKEEFSIANFKKAIDSLPEINQKHLYFYLDKTNTYDKFILAETFFKLRTVNYRAFYDFELIKSLQRATDYENYEPSVVLSFIRLYDKFSSASYNETIDKTFSITKINSIINAFLPYMSDILDLHFGLINGMPVPLKQVPKELNLPFDNVTYLLDVSLKLLKNEYFAI